MRDAANDSVVQAAQHRYRDDIELNTKPVIKARTIPAVPWSDLANLVEHVRKSLHLVAQTIAKGTPLGGPESSTNIIVLDDVSLRHARSAATVQACD